jgi:hypothetical protein
MSTSNNITILLKEVEKIYKQIDELKQNSDKLEIKKYVESMSKLIDTKENLLKIILDSNSKINPTISDFSLSRYTFFDDIDIKNMQTKTSELKDIYIFEFPKSYYLHSYLGHLYYNRDDKCGRYTYIKKDNYIVDEFLTERKYLKLPICNIKIHKYLEIHDFLNVIKYESYIEHSRTYYLKNI